LRWTQAGWRPGGERREGNGGWAGGTLCWGRRGERRPATAGSSSSGDGAGHDDGKDGLRGSWMFDGRWYDPAHVWWAVM